MSETKKITLLEPVRWHEKDVRVIELREPTGGQHRRFGDPRILVQSSGGGLYFVEAKDVIDKYLDVCCTHEGGGDLLNLLSLADSIQVKEALLSFFMVAEARIHAARSATSSSAPHASATTAPSP